MTNALRTTDITDPTRDQVAAVESGVHAALDAIGIDLDGRAVSILDWTNEHGASGKANLRGGTLTVRYLVKSEG